MHSTNNLEDGYMGSGKRLRASIRKHGEDNHTKEIIAFYDTRELLAEAEKEVITDDMVDDKNCMNLMGGGNGGFISDEQQRYRSECGGKALHEKMRTDKEFRELQGEKLSKSVKQAHVEGKMKTWKDNYDWTGKSHSEETKRKMSDTNKGKGTGEANSQYGTCWITKDGSNKKVKKSELDVHITQGWEKGRKIN